MLTNISKCLIVVTALISGILISGCSGRDAMNDYALAGQTVALAAGWQKDFNKKNIEITITPSAGADIVIPAGDPAIRASVNMYVDPVSSAVVSREVGKNQTFNANIYAALINGITNGDKDWYQTTILLDLPSILPTGTTSITITNTQGDSVTSLVEIIPGVGTPHTFTADSSTQVNNLMFLSLQRTTNYEIAFDTTNEIPHAIEVKLLHNPDIDNGGTGKAFAVNPLGYKKNLSWNDDGTKMTAILLPAASGKAFDHMHDFKFYVAGKIDNLTIDSVQAYNENGDSVNGVISATISQHDL